MAKRQKKSVLAYVRKGAKKQVDISIIVPALNEEHYIETCLNALSKQRYFCSYEIIVADGYSTDRTREIAKKYADKIVIEHSRTIAAGRQAGASVASGKILVYTDADTIAPADWLTRLCAPFADKKVSATFGSLMPFDGTPFDDFICLLMNPLTGVLNALGCIYVYGNNMAFKRKAFDQIGGFNVNLITAEDTDIMKRIRCTGATEYVPHARVLFSMRRVRKWGYPKYLAFHTANFFRTHIMGKSFKKYEPVR
ncbi:Glycosyltransferase AglE [Candidatus Anstonella stagnisolia]|nr:Glycosyltransferase AglE [Candidatus Anstonella stagnisolia]